MKVIWSRKALAEREAIWLYLADRNIDYADRAERRLIERADSLVRFPKLGRRLRDDDRRLSATDIQYVLDYRIEDHAIRILRVRSTAQNFECRNCARFGLFWRITASPTPSRQGEAHATRRQPRPVAVPRSSDWQDAAAASPSLTFGTSSSIASRRM